MKMFIFDGKKERRAAVKAYFYEKFNIKIEDLIIEEANYNTNEEAIILVHGGQVGEKQGDLDIKNIYFPSSTRFIHYGDAKYDGRSNLINENHLCFRELTLNADNAHDTLNRCITNDFFEDVRGNKIEGETIFVRGRNPDAIQETET